jgi:hypothetical protein
MEKIFDDFCKSLEEKKDYVKLLADRKLQLEVWFEVEMYMLLDQQGVEFKTEKEYPDKKGWFADLKVEEKNLVEVKVRLLKSGFGSILNRTVKEAFGRLSKGVKDRMVSKWCLVIIYPLLRSKEQLAKIDDENANIQIARRYSFDIDDKNDCLVLLYRMS